MNFTRILILEGIYGRVISAIIALEFCEITKATTFERKNVMEICDRPFKDMAYLFVVKPFQFFKNNELCILIQLPPRNESSLIEEVMTQ